ncbi:hypothetical protein [Saccharothrix australiensis]|uniref:hypothetical protein n=1 Tax=Saccharothrix australiensis TaxID=2072 RepID=UPI000EACD533|nr:hypothetical protein [Saccharothrix australiensis]
MHNRVTGDHHAVVIQVGSVHGAVSIHSGHQPAVVTGLVSVVPPIDRLTIDLHGRDRLLDALADLTLRQDGATVVLHGAGGSGKTAVALALADHVLRRHPRTRVWWIDASTDPSLSAGFREVALNAGAPVDHVVAAWTGTRSPIGVLADALAAATGPWLVVIDNADDTRTHRPWLPALRQRTGAVVITSRDGNTDTWPPDTRLHPVGPLAAGHAADLLLALAPRAGTREQALGLARTLGGLPLALHLAGRYLRAAADLPPVPGLDLPVDFEHYRRVLREQFPRVDRLHLLGGGLADRALLTRTWELSLDLLADLGLPRARPLLRWLACFAQAPLPYTVVDADILAHSPLFQGITGIDVARTLTALTDFGLVDEVTFHDPRASTATTRCLLLHPLIREANRHQPDLLAAPHPYLALCTAVLDGTTTHLSTTDPDHLSRWAALAPHCEHVVDHVTRHGGLPPRWELFATRLTRAVALLAHLTGAHARARTLFGRVLDVRRRHLDEHHPDVLTVRRDLAWLGWTTATPEDTARRRAGIAALADDCAAHLGPSHPLTLACRFDLSWIDSCLERDPSTLDRHRDVIRAERAALGHHDVSGVTAQLTLVTRLWREAHQAAEPDTAAVRAEFTRLLAMLDDLEQHTDVHHRLPQGLVGLRATARELFARFEHWREHCGGR